MIRTLRFRKILFVLSSMFCTYLLTGLIIDLIPKNMNTNYDYNQLYIQEVSDEKPLPDIGILPDNANLTYFIHYYREMCNYMRILNHKIEKGLCPCLPKTLVGSLNIDLEPPTLDSIILANPAVQEGGRWKPSRCTARQTVAIIIPLRGGEASLRILLKYLHPILQRQKLNYHIFVVEQANEESFNKGVIMNAGFKEATSRGNFDCLIFHDVDIIPEDDRSIYSCTKYIRHFTPFTQRYEYILPHQRLFEGALSFTPDQFRLVNGFSSELSGLGGEDDDMYNRVASKGLSFIRYPKIVCKYKNVPKDLLNTEKPIIDSLVHVWRQEGKHHSNGLNSLKYSIKEIKYLHLYTWILVDLNVPK